MHPADLKHKIIIGIAVIQALAAQTGMDTKRIWRFSASATEGPADVLDSTSRSLKERNAVDVLGSAAAVEAS
jgi:hypothetical protein